MILWLFTYMLIPKVVDNSASSNIQPPIFWYVVCIHETQLLVCLTPKSELSVIGSFLWPKSATKMILITLLTKSTLPNEIICINDHSEVWIGDFCPGRLSQDKKPRDFVRQDNLFFLNLKNILNAYHKQFLKSRSFHYFSYLYFF